MQLHHCSSTTRYNGRLLDCELAPGHYPEWHRHYDTATRQDVRWMTALG